MEPERIMALLQASGFVPPVRFYKFVMDDSTKPCDRCLRLAGEVFAENDPRIPELPLHPNCDCSLIEINQNEYLQLKDFEFGNMSHERWYEQTEEKNIYGVIVSEIDSEKP